MSWYFKPYVPVAQRRAKALRKVTALKNNGEAIEPVEAATPRGKIAVSFWGQAWCDHLESYSDFANRLPRGRTYLRNGSVLHLGIQPGKIDALVMGSALYRQRIRIDPLPAGQWEAVKQRCQGKIGSLIELLQGRISHEIMAIVTDREAGLFPRPSEIHLGCSCPDWADLCKHLAAVLYGVGARLDTAPELLFKLRGVEHNELIQTDASVLPGAGGRSSRRRTLAPSALADVFGIEMDDEGAPAAAPPPRIKSNAQSDSRVKRTPKRGSAPANNAARKPAKKPADPAPFKATSSAIRALRERLGLSRAAFAAELGVSVQTIGNWENKGGALNLQSGSLSKLRRLHRRSG